MARDPVDQIDSMPIVKREALLIRNREVLADDLLSTDPRSAGLPLSTGQS